MSYKLMIRLAAQAEATEIHDWYEARSKGLGAVSRMPWKSA